MSANSLQGFDAVAQNIPTIAVAAIFQKDPQVLLAHPGQGVEKFEDLKKLTLLVSSEGLQSYFKWMQAEFGFAEDKVKPYTFNPQPFLVDKKQRDAGLRDVGAVRGRESRQVQAEDLSARRSRLQHLLDADRDAPRDRREAARPGAALRRCLGDRLVQLSLRRQQAGERADPEAQSRK